MLNQGMLNKIILIGYRATGKSSVAMLLANRLQWRLIDTDPMIEEVAGKSIAKIFAENGETVFRDLEASIMASVLRETDSLVISTGGGAPLREKSRLLMKKNGLVFWLTASPKTIALRMNLDATTVNRRPSLTGLSPLQEIEEVLAKRTPIYQDVAHYVINTENRSLEEIVNQIFNLYKQQLKEL